MKMKKVASSLLITFILIAIFTGLLKISPIVRAEDVPNVWISDPSVVSGLTDVGDHATPTVRFNVTGVDKRTLISGDALGNFHGYYWNGINQWTQDFGIYNETTTFASGFESDFATEGWFTHDGYGHTRQTSIKHSGSYAAATSGSGHLYHNLTQPNNLTATVWLYLNRSSSYLAGLWLSVGYWTDTGVYQSVYIDYFSGAQWLILKDGLSSTEVTSNQSLSYNTWYKITLEVWGNSGVKDSILYINDQPVAQTSVDTAGYYIDDFFIFSVAMYSPGIIANTIIDDVELTGYPYIGQEIIGYLPNPIAGLGNIGGTPGGWNYSTPYLSYNVTGDGNWTLICGRYKGDFRGFYWNGSQWIEKSSYVQGLGDVGEASAPSMAFNVTGDGKWTLISGEYEGFYAFYWNGSQWVSDSTRKTGLRGVDGEYNFIPDLAYNLRGDDKWCLIAGGYYYPTYGYQWNGSQWNFYGLVVANAIWQIGNFPECAMAFVYNLTGSGDWHIIGGGHNGNFYGLTLEAPTTANQIVELGRGLLEAGQAYVYGFTYSGGYLYGGTQNPNPIPQQVVKFSIGTMEEVANFTLATDDGYTEESCAIVVGDYLYLGNWKNPGPARIVKVDLTTFSKVSTLMLNSSDTSVWDLASDGTYLYAACSTARLVRIDLSDFTRKDHLTLSATAYSLQYENGYLYAGISSGLVHKVDVSTFTITDTLDVDSGMSVPIECLASKGDGWLYAGYTDSSPVGYIRKVNLTTFSNDARLKVGTSGSGIYVDHMVIVGDNMFFLDSMFLRHVYLPSFSLGTYRSFIDTSYDLATDGFYVYVSPGTAPALFEKFYFTGAVLHSVTVTANPSISFHFSIDGIVYTTPYTTNLPEGSHTFQVVDVFPKSGNFFLIYEHWTFNGADDNGGAYATITKNINVASTLVIHYHVGVLELKFEDDFETGNLDKWTGTDRQTNKYDHQTSTVEVTGTAKYAGSYGLQANGVGGQYGGHAFAYKTNSPMNYVYLNFMVYVPTGQTRGWFGLLRPHGLTMTLSETGYTDTPDCTQFSVGWHTSHFEVVYWRGDLEYIKDDISGFQFNTWYNITMFLRTGSDGLYALWVNGVLRWYRFHDDTSLWGGYSSYVGARAWTESKTNYVDDVKISAFVDPTFVTLTVNSIPLETVAFTINGAQYYTPSSILLTPGTYQLAAVEMTLTVNDTTYVFTYWMVGSTQINSAAFNLVLTSDTTVTLVYQETGLPPYRPPEPTSTPTPRCENWWLFIFALIILILTWVVGEYYKRQWVLLLPAIPELAWALWVVLNNIPCNSHWRWMILICLVAIAYSLYRYWKYRKATH
jgi:hypothetical protein